jgi:hypothetical protein
VTFILVSQRKKIRTAKGTKRNFCSNKKSGIPQSKNFEQQGGPSEICVQTTKVFKPLVKPYKTLQNLQKTILNQCQKTLFNLYSRKTPTFPRVFISKSPSTSLHEHHKNSQNSPQPFPITPPKQKAN